MPVFGGLIFAGMFMISELITNYNTSKETKLALLVLEEALSMILMLFFIRWEQDRWFGKKYTKNTP